jgi:hypothetical protein
MSDENKPAEDKDAPENKVTEESEESEIVAHAADGEELPWCVGCAK